MLLLAVGRVLTWTLAVGVTSFALGFFGPMVLAPGANQGPMLGIFITGPLGFLAGLGIGVVREFLGHTAGPVAVLRDRLPNVPLRPIAMLGGGFLFVYGVIALGRGEGRPAAATIVLAAAIIYFGVTGRAPKWLRL